MTIRTSRKTVSFARAFTLDVLDEVQPAGDYIVETDEERLEAVSFPAYRRVATVIHLRAKSGDPALARILTIDPKALDAALERARQIGRASCRERRCQDELNSG